MGLQSQMINIGGAPDDGTGDTIRAAFAKLNSNLNEYDTYISRGFGISDTVIPADASAGITVIPIMAANNPAANVTTVFKIKSDTSGNPARITPAGGTISEAAYYELTVSKSSVRLFPNAAENEWYVI